MKAKTLLAILAATGSLLASLQPTGAQGTAFTYQGRLNEGTSPASGSYDLTFTLFGDVGNAVAGPLLKSDITVSNGLFMTTLDFGENFPDANRWLEIAVRTNGITSFITLAPRQLLTPTPYAITAENVNGRVSAAQLSGTLPSSLLAGTYGSTLALNNAGNSFSGNGVGLTSVNASLLGGLSANQFWKLTGNGGTTQGVNFVGTTDNQPLELKANSQRALRLEPSLPTGAPNFIAGSYVNYVMPGKVGAAIGGGGATNYVQSEPALGGYYGVSSNQVFSDFGTIGGGGNNLIQSNSTLAAIGGGAFNIIQTNSRNSTIGGGLFNTIQTNGAFSAIGGGLDNMVSGAGDFIGGGGYDSLIGFYGGNIIMSDASVVGGGYGNKIVTGDFSIIGGGIGNVVGFNNGVYSANNFGSTIGGGELNTNSGEFATIPGGYQNYAQGYSSFAAGQNANALHNGAFVWADDSSTTPFSSTANNQFLIRASGGVGINLSNPTDAALSVAGKVRLNDNNLYLRPGTDVNHGLGYYYGTKSFAGNTTLDGPVLFGYGGGILGTEAFGTEHIAVQWSPSSVTVNGTFNNNSDRNAKQDFTPLSPSQILDKVLQLPVSEWSYKVDATTRHVGPMAQDFYSVFGIGTDERHIAPIDEGGVALAAIQGLNERVDEKDAKIHDLEHQNTLLEKRLSELEQLVQSLTEKK